MMSPCQGGLLLSFQPALPAQKAAFAADAADFELSASKQAMCPSDLLGAI